MNGKLDASGLQRRIARMKASRALAAGLLAMAIAIQAHAIKSIQRNSGKYKEYKRQQGKKIHWSSPPGSPPNSDTGNLAAGQNWTTEQSEEGGVSSLTLTVRVPYARWLEYGTRKANNEDMRPFLRPAIKATRKKRREILAKAVRSLARGDNAG